MLVDTHSHLYLEDFADDIDSIMSRAKGAGLRGILLPNIDSGTLDLMNGLASRFQDTCFPMIGLHPCSVKEGFREDLAFLESKLGAQKYVGIGETGLDYYWDTTFIEQQKEALRIQIGWAKEHRMPIVLHSRESFDDLVELISEHKDDTLSGVFHCFTGTVEEATRVTAMRDFYLGVGGVVTYKNTVLRETLAEIGLDRVVLETDSPYLAPVPHRGKRNESSYLKLVAEKVAECCQVSVEEVARITTRNAQELFKLD